MSEPKCNGKICYSKKDAETARNHRTKGRGRRHNRPDFLRVYHCPDCNFFHLTSKP